MPKINQDIDQYSDLIELAHTPVLLKEVLHFLQPSVGQSYFDVTAGGGGHAAAVLEHTKTPKSAVLVDRDSDAVATLKKHLGTNGVQIIHQDFLSASQKLEREGRQFDMVLADIGASSLHFEQSSRGFAFKHSGPLDMRMDKRQELTAAIILNQWQETEIASVLSRYGEEPKARQIAKRIVARRPLRTTDQLATIVASSASWRRPGRNKIHPATRTFQALRIAVNDELAQLQQSLPVWLRLLTPAGRLVVISFHSLEDRLVKRFFAEQATGAYDAQASLLTKKPVTASHDEIVSNPRARSAKLRAVAKIKTPIERKWTNQ